MKEGMYDLNAQSVHGFLVSRYSVSSGVGVTRRGSSDWSQPHLLNLFSSKEMEGTTVNENKEGTTHRNPAASAQTRLPNVSYKSFSLLGRSNRACTFQCGVMSHQLNCPGR